MYAPATKVREDEKTSPAQAGSAFWDEPTLVVPPKPKMQLGPESSYTKSYNSSPLPKNRVEKYACVYPGCLRKFVNEAELRNHVEILHQLDQEAFEDPEVAYPPAAIAQQEIDIENAIESTRASYHHAIETEEDQTVKPVRITAAALEALNLNAEPQHSKLADEESVTGSDIHASSASLMSVDTTYSVLEPTEEVAVSEVARPDDPRIKLAVRMLLILWARFLSDFVARRRTGHRQHGQYSGTYHQQESPSQPSPHASSSSSFASSSRSRKRKPNPDEEGEDNRRKAPSIRASQGHVSPENMPLACPFNKYDSFAFGGDGNNSKYSVCSTWHDVKTAYLKQHLLRSHCLPLYHCVRCGLDCKNDVDLRKHQRAQDPCAVKELDSQKLLPEVQQELGLRARNIVAINKEEYWYKVYDTIFGSEARKTRPVDPHYKGPSHEIIEAFLHFSERRMSQVLRQSRPSLQTGSEDYNENNSDLVRTILQEASQEFIAARRAVERQSLQKIREQNTPSGATSDAGEQTVIVRDQQAIGSQQATEAIEMTPHPWNPGGADIPQASNMVPFQPSPHAAEFTQSHYYNLPTRGVDHDLSQQTDINNYDQPHDFSFTSLGYHSLDFDINDPEGIATIEDPDMYSGHSIDMHNIEGYSGYHEASSQRDP